MNGCTHGAKSTPADCSQCAGIAAKQVTTVNHQLHVDGIPVGREYQPERVITARRSGVKRRK